jgi:hypothetical protein
MSFKSFNSVFNSISSECKICLDLNKYFTLKIYFFLLKIILKDKHKEIRAAKCGDRVIQKFVNMDANLMIESDQNVTF